mmetsp:Transcript_3597/g.6826  ORF Transcript_3597/g.6826 Transcript_3597/m.6826 type:complete len:224 (+) Transcript_3597:248-919(+)
MRIIVALLALALVTYSFGAGGMMMIQALALPVTAYVMIMRGSSLLYSSTNKGQQSSSDPAFKKINFLPQMSKYPTSSSSSSWSALHQSHEEEPKRQVEEGDYQNSGPMPQLPDNVVKYSQVPNPKVGKVFTANTIPKGLLKMHSTKVGTWGVIRVFKGELEYVLEAVSSTASDIKFHLTSDFHGVIEPNILHHVSPLTSDVEFVVEFYRVPGTGPVDEKREGL